MQFFKKMLGFGNDLGERIDKFKARGALFQVVKDTRNIKFKDCTISFSGGEVENTYTIDFKTDSQQFCQLPIHLNMNAVTFTINKGGKLRACFEWQLQQQTQHVGCNMQIQRKQQFLDILCLILKNMAKDEHIKDYHSFCKELTGIPVYKTGKEANSNVTSGIASESKIQLNEVLIAEAQKDNNKMVHSCSYYRVELRQRKLIQQNVVFVLRQVSSFEFEFQLINATGYAILRKKVDSGLNYEINVDKGYIRWIDVQNDCQLIEVNFQGKRDAALSLKYNMLEVMYQLREKRKLQQDVLPEQIAFMKRMSDDTLQEKVNSKVVEIYKEKEIIEEVGQDSYLYEDSDRKKGAKYDNICQAHIADFSIVALGSLMETLKISEDNAIKQQDKRRLVDPKGYEVQIGQILLHDSDSKGFIRGKKGKLYYQDLVKGKLIEQFDPSPQKGVISICPQRKGNGNFNTFKVLSQNALYQIDPRTKQGVGSLKDYSTNPQFVALSSTSDGNFVTGSKKGQIRFYKQIGKNANNKFTSHGDPVIHLDTTKDGRWTLATFRRYLRLIPTQTNQDISLFDKKVNLSERPTPIKLDISLEDLQKFAIQDFYFLPAKFDESNNNLERFIISGFGQYTVIWSLSKAIKGDRSYIVSKNEGKVDQADFIFDDPSKLIMATSQGIVIKQNKIRKRFT